jgi:hypothetical protein
MKKPHHAISSRAIPFAVLVCFPTHGAIGLRHEWGTRILWENMRKAKAGPSLRLNYGYAQDDTG